MKKELLFEALGYVDDEFLAPLTPEKQPADAAPQSPSTSKKFFRHPTRHGIRYALALGGATFLLFAVLSIIPLFSRKQTASDLFPLSGASTGVTVSLLEKAPETITNSSSDLIFFSEEELFTEFDTDIFSGTITEIQNIVLDFHGDKNYRAIASIQIDRVFRGNGTAGDTVKILLPCPVGVTGFAVSETEVVSKMCTGMRGIFMPMVYRTDSYCEQNGAKLLLTDLAPYGLADGERYCFLETAQGIAFARWAYESIQNATSLSEIESYIEAMLGKISIK